MNAGSAIYTILTGDQTLVDLVSSRIYPEAAPENVVSPFVVYSVQSVDPIRVKNSTSTMDTANFEVFTSAVDYATAMEINDAIRTAMERRSGNFQGVAIDSIEFIDENVEIEIESREYLSELRFRIRIARAGAVVSSSTIVPLGINVRETNDATSDFVKTVVFPDTALDVTNDVATVTFSTGGGGDTVTMVRANMTASNVLFGSTVTTIPLGEIGIQTGSGASVSLGALTVGTAGTASISIHLIFGADTNHQLPHVRLFKGDRQLMECTGYITGQHGDDHTSVSGTIMDSISSSDTFILKAFNEAGNNNILVESATVSVVLLE